MAEQISATRVLAELMINRVVLIELIKSNNLEQKVRSQLEGVEVMGFVVDNEDGPKFAVPEFSPYVKDAADTFIAQLDQE